MNKGERGLVATALGVGAGTLLTYADLFSEKTHMQLNAVGESLGTVLLGSSPSSDDIIFFSSALLAGILSYLVLPKSKSTSSPETLD